MPKMVGNVVKEKVLFNLRPLLRLLNTLQLFCKKGLADLANLVTVIKLEQILFTLKPSFSFDCLYPVGNGFNKRCLG